MGKNRIKKKKEKKEGKINLYNGECWKREA